LYRFERDGWTIDDVAVEMRRQTYKYGWLPGYMYAMAKNKPTSSRPRAEMLDDRNRARGPGSERSDEPTIEQPGETSSTTTARAEETLGAGVRE